MFGTIRKHQAWLWWFIGGITIISFVILGPSSCNNMKPEGLRGNANYGTIGGRPIKQEEIQNAEQEVTLRYFLTTQQWPDAKSDFNVRREALIRLLLIEKEKEFDIQVSAETLAEFARHIIGTARLEDFETKFLKPAGLNQEDFERFLLHESGAQQLMMVAGISGKLVTPGEAETEYRQEHQELSTLMIPFVTSNYMSSVTVSNDALLQFYTNRMSVYREPARMQVNYIKFNVTNYWAATVKSLTNLDLSVKEAERKMGTNLYRRTTTPEESREAIKNEMIREQALLAARREAGKFAEELDAMTPKKLENLETLGKQKGLAVGTTEPFDEENGPKALDVLLNFPKAAFQLTEQEPFSGSVVAEDGVYVLGFKKLVPASVPPFHTVEAKATADYRYYQAMLLVQQSGIKFYNALTNGLAHGKTFNTLTAELGLKTESLPPFSLSTTSLPEAIENRVPMNSLRQLAFSTPVGSVSQMGRSRDGAFMLYVEKKLPVDEAKLKVDLPGFLSYMRQARQGDAFNQWFNQQIHQDPAFMAAVQQASQDAQMRSAAKRPK